MSRKSNRSHARKKIARLHHRLEVKNDVINCLKNKIKPSLSKPEQKASRDLLRYNSIIIRPADKGSGIIVDRYREIYEESGKKVDNDKTYVRTQGGGLLQAEKRVKKVVNRTAKDCLG